MNSESSPWIPLLRKPKLNESFVSDSQSTGIVGTIFTVAGAIFFAAIITFLFYWAYTREKTLFIACLCVMVFAYSLMNIIGFVLVRGQLQPMFFESYLGAAIIMCLLSGILIVIFSVKASRHLKESFRRGRDPYGG